MKNSKHLFGILTIILMLTAALPGQWDGRGRMKGIVNDENGVPLADVKVKLFSVRGQAGLEKTTDQRGEWRAYMVRGGEWHLDFIKSGFEPLKITVSIDESGKVFDWDVTLKELAGIALGKEILDQLEKGNQLFNQGDFQGAMKLYQDILKDDPDAYIVHLNVGNCLFSLNDYQAAIESYARVLERDEKHVDAIIATGNAYSNMGQAAAALEWYSKVAPEKISDSTVLYNIGVSYFNASRFDEAARFLRLSADKRRGNLDALYQLGLVYMGQGDFKAAVSALEEYLGHDPDSARAAQVKEILAALKQAK